MFVVKGIDKLFFNKAMIYYSDVRVLDWKAYPGMELIGFAHGLNSLSYGSGSLEDAYW